MIEEEKISSKILICQKYYSTFAALDKKAVKKNVEQYFEYYPCRGRANY